MRLKNLKSFLTCILLIFTFISIGYMLGKNSVSKVEKPANNPAGSNYVAVYYMHSTFRCETCNTIEAMTKGLLDREYSTELINGTIHWQEVDFMKNTDLAQAFDVAASCVVVARIRDGKTADYQRLDEVWSLLNKPEQFDDYIKTAIHAYLKTEKDK